MSPRRLLVLSVFLLFVAGIGMVGAAVLPTTAMAMQAPTGTPAAATSAITATVPAPVIPAPVAVQVDPKTTAYLVLDLTSTLCAPRKACTDSLPKAAALLKKARDAQALVVYSDTPGTSTIVPEVASQATEPKVTGRADKFIGTNLDDVLKAKGIKTVVIVGTAANGAVLYTAFGANIRNYTAVVAEDGISADAPFAVLLTRYQLLNQPGFNNPQNQPLAEGRVTLSRSDLITFVAGAPGPKPLATAQPATPAQPTAAATVAATTAATAAPSPASGKVNLDDFMPRGKGRDLVLESCVSCHGLGVVLLGQRTPARWENIRSGHKENTPDLSPEDEKTLYDYLAENFNDQKPEPNLPEGMRKGAAY